MPTGTVKWFDAKKGYGFIVPDDGAKDVYVDLATLEQAGRKTLEEGQKVSYTLGEDRKGRPKAENLSALERRG